MRRVGRLVVAAVVVVASLALSGPAFAADPEDKCVTPGTFCAWIDASYEGNMWAWKGDDGAYDIFVNNEFSSFYNNGTTGMSVRVYDWFWGTGDYLVCLGPGERLHYNAAINDRASSHYWRWGC
jgi:hypothetical protein